jgi:hypothetical protein
MIQCCVVRLSLLLHAASHALATETKEKMAAEMERVQLVFNGLPHDTQNLITLLFVTVSQYHDQLGHGPMRGVVTKSKMKEALRLMGWSTDSVSCSIMLSWYKTLKLFCLPNTHLTFVLC